MTFTSPSGREYVWDKPNPATQADIDSLVEYDKSLGAKQSPSDKLANLAGDVALEAGYSIAGQIAGAETGPGYFLIAPAAGAYGNYIKQQREMERGDRKDLSYSEMISSALINLIPASAMFKTGATVAQTVGKQAALGAVTAATPAAVEMAMSENRFPTLDEYYSVLKRGTQGAVIGGAAGSGLEMAKRLSPIAKEIWNRLSGKTQTEVNQTLNQIVERGSEGERRAAAEILDTVGQDLGLVRPVTKPAEESARVLQAVGSAEESAGRLLGEETLRGQSGSERAQTAAQELWQEAQAKKQAAIRGTAEAAAETVRSAAPIAPRVLSPAEEAAQVFQRAGNAQESAARFLGPEAVQAELAARQAAAQAQAQREELIRRTAQGATSAVEQAAPIPARALSPAEEAAQTLQSVGAARESAGAFQQAMEGRMSGETAKALRARAERERQFAQARAEELQQNVRGSQLAGEESVVMGSSPERMQMNVLDTRSGAAARERERLRQRMGIQEEVLPTTEDVLNEFGAIRGVGSKQKARRMSMEGGSVSVGTLAAAAGVGAAGIGIASAVAAQPKTIVIETPAGEFKYDSSKWSMEDIQKDVQTKMLDAQKTQAASDHLELRKNYENAPDPKTRLELMLNWSKSQRQAGSPMRTMAGAAGETLTQAVGSRFNIGGRALSGAAGEFIRAALAEGRAPTGGEMVAGAISAAPRGTTNPALNLAKFAGARMAGEAVKEGIDEGKFIDFKTAANMAALGGVEGMGMMAAERGLRSKAETSRQRRDLGEIAMFDDAKRLGVILDPAGQTNPSGKQVALVKAAGGSTKFQQDAARVNTPIVMEKFRELAGTTRNPNLDAQMDETFFRARRMEEGRIYDRISSVPGLRTVVADWKQANSDAINEYRKWSNTGKNENLVAAREARNRADNLHVQIERGVTSAGFPPALVTELDRARKKIGELHTIEAAMGPTNKPTDMKVLGQMYEDNRNRYDGDLRTLMRIAAAQPGVLQNASAIGVTRLTKEDLTRLPLASKFLMSRPGQSFANRQSYGVEDPQFAAQLARFASGNVVEEAMRPVPYR